MIYVDISAKKTTTGKSTYRNKCCLQEVTHGGSRTLRLCVAILHTSKLQQPLRRRGGNETSSSGRGDETAHDGTDLAANLRGHSVRLSERSTPVTSPDRDNAELGDDDGGADGRRNLLGRLDTKTDVALRVANDDDGLETSALAGARLLLDGLDLGGC